MSDAIAWCEVGYKNNTGGKVLRETIPINPEIPRIPSSAIAIIGEAVLSHFGPDVILDAFLQWSNHDESKVPIQVIGDLIELRESRRHPLDHEFE